MANHSATHLMSFALENVLGEIRQQGSMVGDSYFTFDFTCRKVCKCYVFLVDSDLHTGRCLICTNANIITSPVGAVVKYCDECICLCVCASVCLSVSISPEPHMRSLPNFLCMLPMAVARSSGRVTKSQGKGQFLGFSSPLTMHCNAFTAKGSFSCQ